MSEKPKLTVIKHSQQFDDWDEYVPSKSKSFKGACHERHKALSLGGGTLLGASCNHPREGFDVYVGLDWGMRRTLASYPWEHDSKVIEVYFPITDGQAPKDVVQFKKMVQWLVEQLALGKRVHVGCIGGHGRTGTLLSALVSVIHGDPKASDWVREHYCKSAVETHEQTKFLEKHFGVVPIEGSKSVTRLKGGTRELDYGQPMVSEYAPLRGRDIWNADWV